MSVLETPRIYFKGEISWDPITTNNYSFNYDEASGETKLADVAHQVQAFRDAAIAQVGKGSWNPHGTHRSTFYDTSINGFDLGAGVQTDDPLVSAPAVFTGMLVDLEPYGGVTSQLYFDRMRFGVDGGYCIDAPRTARFTARHINFQRNSANTMIAGIASVVWQSSFSKADGLSIVAFDSKALGALATSLEADDVEGLTVRFNTYRTIYYDDATLRNGSPATTQAAQILIGKLKDGGFQPNPARSLLVGVVGLWRKGEPAHEPGDRVLAPSATSTVMAAFARVGTNRITIDLANSVSEVDGALTKQNVGPLTLTAAPANAAPITLGVIDYAHYDRAAYEATAGLVVLPLDETVARQITTADLQIMSGDGTANLTEIPLRAIPATPNCYLDEAQSATTTFQVYDRGQPANSVQQVSMYPMDAAGGTPGAPVPMTTNAQGVLSMPLTGAAGAVMAYVPSMSAADVPSQGINTQVNTYMYVRSRPADADIASLPPTWENVYTHVLANWNAMAPCMDNWLMLNDPVQVRRYAALIRRLTDPARFEEFRFMPITRDMSTGERSLLYKFLDGSDEQVPVAAMSAEHATHAKTFAELSRAMRGGTP